MKDSVNEIVIPVGMSIAIIINAVLIYLSVSKFKGRKMFTKTKVTTVLVFVSIILYDLVSIFRKSVLKEHCTVREPLRVVSYLFSRSSLYYFFVIRMELTFAGSGIQFSPKLIKALKTTILTVYGLSCLFFLATSPFQRYDAVKNGCYPDQPVKVPFYVVSVLYALVDLLLGIIICSLYLYRLYGVYKLFKATAAVVNDINAEALEKKDEKLLNVIKKQGKLAYVAYISTLLLIVFAPGMGLGALAFIDGIINGLSVYCTFDWNGNLYQYLCNCGGNKYLQCLFCFCCYCCNERRLNDVDYELKVKSSQSDGSTKGPSVTSNETSTQSSNDTTNQTVETVETVIQ